MVDPPAVGQAIIDGMKGPRFLVRKLAKPAKVVAKPFKVVGKAVAAPVKAVVAVGKLATVPLKGIREMRSWRTTISGLGAISMALAAYVFMHMTGKELTVEAMVMLTGLVSAGLGLLRARDD